MSKFQVWARREAEVRPSFEFKAPSPSQTREARERIDSLFGDVELDRPAQKQLSEIIRMIRTMEAENRTIELWPDEVKRWAPWAIFLDKNSQPLAGSSSLLKRYLVFLKQRPPAIQYQRLGNLAWAYLSTYPTELTTLAGWGSGITQQLNKSEHGRLAKLQAYSDELRMFQPDGPAQVARLWLDERTPSHKAAREFAATKLISKKPLGSSPFASEMTRALFEQMAAMAPPEPDEREERLRLVLSKEDKIRFPELRGIIAQGLLLPYRDAWPETATRERLLNLLTEPDNLGHPEYRQQDSPWEEIPDARDIAQRWLAARAIYLFLDAVSNTTTNKKHWSERRPFWEAYLRLNAVHRARAVLGPEAAAWVKAQHPTSHRPHFSRFPGSRDTNIAKKSALLLQIEDLVIAEWSHAGSCRIWNHPEGAPALRPGNYHRKTLSSTTEFVEPTTGKLIRTADFSTRHIGDWQDRVSRHIREQSGISITQKDYIR